MIIKIKKLTDTAKIPTRGSRKAAGYDLYADIQEPVDIVPHTTEKIPTGIATEIPDDYFVAIFPRSGLSTKKGLNLINAIPVIDSDYRGEWLLPMHNNGLATQTIEPGERIAQMIVLPCLEVDFEEAEELSSTDRGTGGFGSTGTK